MASNKIRGITIELNADTAGIMDGLKDINKSLSSTERSLKDVNKLLKLDPDNVELLTQKQDYLTDAIEDTKKKLEEEQKLLDSLKSADNAEETAEQQKALAREIEATNQKLNKYQGELEQTELALDGVADETKQASDNALTFGDILKANVVSQVVLDGIKKLAEGITEVAKSSLEAGMSFESSMSQVAATMGLTTDEIRNGSETYEKMAAAAKKMGQTTQFSASQAADALNYLALAGYDADKAVATLPSVLTLAAAGGMELAYASDLVTDSMSALGLETEDLDRYIDEMARAAQKSNTSVGQLGEAILVAGGTAKITGLSLEAMNAELGVLANVGIKGSEGGTHLRNVLLSLSAPTEKAADKLKELNVEAKDSDGNMRNLNDIMIDLNEALADLGSADKAAAIKAIFNKTDIAAVNALLVATNGEYEKLTDEMYNAEGAAKEMAEVMLDNLEGNITILKSALEGLQIAFYEVFDDNAKQVVNAATDALGDLTDAVTNGELGTSLEHLSESLGKLATDFIESASDGLPKFIDGVAYLVDNIPDLITAIEGLATGYVTYNAVVKIAELQTKALNGTLIAQPYALIAAAIVGVTAALVDMTKDAIEARKAASDLEKEIAGISEKYTNEEKSIRDARDTILKYKDATKLTAEEHKELSDAIDTWNSKASESAQITQNMSGLIENWTAATEELIRAEYEEIQATEDTAHLKDIAEERAKAQELLAEKTRELEEAQEEYNKSIENGETSTSAWLDKVQNAQEQMEIAAQAVKELDTEYDILSEGLAEYEQAQEDANNASSNAPAAMGETSQAARELHDVLLELDEAYVENKEKAVDALEAQRNAFAKLKDQAKGNVKDIAQELSDQAEGMKRYADDIAEAEAIMEVQPGSEGLLNYYIQKGPEAASELEALINAFNGTTEEVEAFKQACASFSETEALIDGLADLNEAIGTGSSEAIQLALEALDEDLPAMTEAFQTAWDEQTEAADLYRENMTNTVTGTVTDMADSITTNTPLVTNASKAMTEESIKSVKTALQYNDQTGRSEVFYELGMQVDQSIADGMTDNQGVVASALQSVFDNAINSLDLSGISSRINAKLGEQF